MTMKSNFNKQLLEVLVCPISKSKLEYDEKNQELISKKSGLAYPIKDGIPIMLPGESRKVNSG